ncbi:MAG: hypothetical protein RSD36_17910 [Terrisporobacter sp.]
MESGISKINVMKFAGAFIAFIIGSGFATGQEIMQFFTSNGLWSVGSIIISLVLFTYFGSTVMGSGYDHRRFKNHRPYKYFCGNAIGVFYEYFVPILLFTSVVIMVSGAGATLKEYYGLNYYIGCAMMVILVLIAYICGLESLINIIGLIGPVIVVFSLIVGFTILFQNLDGLHNISDTITNINMPKAGGKWIRSGIIYAAYNMVGGVMFFTTLGENADTREEAKWGAIVGSGLLMLVILVMNLALLSKIGDVYKLSIPTLYFAKSISPFFGKVFSVVLLCGIFSTAAPNFWTVCNRLSKNGSYRPTMIAIILSIVSFFCGLLPFEKLVEYVYPYTGLFGVILFVCIFYKQMRKRII